MMPVDAWGLFTDLSGVWGLEKAAHSCKVGGLWLTQTRSMKSGVLEVAGTKPDSDNFPGVAPDPWDLLCAWYTTDVRRPRNQNC